MMRDVETLPTRAPMRPRNGRRVEIRNGRRQDRSELTARRSAPSAYARRTEVR